MLCRIVGVAVSGFHARLRRRPGRRREGDRRAGDRIGAIFAASRRTCGSPRVHAEPRAEGVRVGRERVARLVREGGLAVARRRRTPRATGSRHDHPVAPDLLDRKLAAERPDAARLADISCIPAGEGWLHLAATKDLATREVVGRSMADRLRAELACDALRMAPRRRQPPPGLTHHSDRGVRHACKDYRAILARHGIRQSMTARATAGTTRRWRASPAASRASSCAAPRSRPGRRPGGRSSSTWKPYNRRRRHSGLGFLTPAQAYAQTAGAA